MSSSRAIFTPFFAPFGSAGRLKADRGDVVATGGEVLVSEEEEEEEGAKAAGDGTGEVPVANGTEEAEEGEE